jgi:hypothetical protein
VSGALPRSAAWLRARTDAPTLFFVVASAVSTVFLVVKSRGLWFFTDEWEFLLNRSISGAGVDQGVFAPHNEHWTTVPILVFRALFHVFGLSSYHPYVALSIGLHVVVCALLYALMRRTDVSPWAASLSVVVLTFLCGGGAMNALWAFQIGFLGSAACGLLALLLAERLDSPVRWAAVWLVSVVGLMTSGMSLMMLVWLGCFVLMGQGLRLALTATIPPLVVYAVWYVVIGHTGTTGLHLSNPEVLIQFFLTGLAAIWGQALLVPGIGGVMFLVLVVTALAAPATERTRALALSGIASALVAYAVLALTRGNTGLETPTKGRYVYFGLVLTLPAFAVLLSTISAAMTGRRVEQAFAFVTVAVLFAATGAAQTAHYVTSRLPNQIGPQQVAGAVALADEGATFLSTDVDPSFAVVSIDDLLRPAARRALPGGRVTAVGRLDASVQMQAAAQPQAFDLPFSQTRMRAIRMMVRTPGCSTLVVGHGAEIDLPPSVTGSQVALVPQTPALQVAMTGGGASSHRRALPATPGGRIYVATSSSKDTLRVFLPPGRISLCRS